MIKKLASSFSFFVFTGIILGLATGGYPAYTNEISMISLITAMTFSLLPISFTSLSLKKSSRNIIIAVLLNFGFLSTLTITLGLPFPEDIMKGFIVMAAVPTAIAVLPITTLLKGDVKYTLISLSSLYLTSFILTPLIILIFLQKDVNTTALLRDILLLIALPLTLSRFIRKLQIPKELPRVIANICFFLLVFGIIGKNRVFLFYNPSVVLFISAALLIRTFGSGMLIKWIGRKKGLTREETLPFSLFASFKNEGMAILLCISLFPPDIAYVAAVPAVVAIIWEMTWACCLETKII